MTHDPTYTIRLPQGIALFEVDWASGRIIKRYPPAFPLNFVHRFHPGRPTRGCWGEIGFFDANDKYHEPRGRNLP